MAAQTRKECWEPLEGTPKVLNAVAKGLGLHTNSWEFVDVLGFDDELLSLLPSGAAALIFLYPTTDTDIQQYLNRSQDTPTTIPKSAVFLKQLIGGTCGTLAVVHAVTNATPCQSAISPDSPLARIRNDCDTCMDVMARSRRFIESNGVRQSHDDAVFTMMNEYGNGNKSKSSLAGQRQGRHFVTFVNHEDLLLELDGRRDTPVCRGRTSSATFLTDAVSEIRTIVASTKDESIHTRCSLVALVPTISR